MTEKKQIETQKPATEIQERDFSAIFQAIEATCPSIHERAKTQQHDWVELTRMQEVSNRILLSERKRIREIIEKEMAWLDGRIQFAKDAKVCDDSMDDQLGERYWHGIIVAYMGAKEHFLSLLRDVEVE